MFFVKENCGADKMSRMAGANFVWFMPHDTVTHERGEEVKPSQFIVKIKSWEDSSMFGMWTEFKVRVYWDLCLVGTASINSIHW